MSHYWNQLYRLKFIKRWGTSISFEPESVAEHSYFVALAAYKLAELDEALNGIIVDKEKLLIRALHHDIYESYTAHIVSPIKHYTCEIDIAMKMLAKDYSKHLENLMPYSHLQQSSEENDSFSDNTVYIDAADAIDAYCFCALQSYLGNRDFENKLSLMRQKVTEFSAKYNFVHDFIENLFDEKDFETIY